ncbi:hypothetical protein ACHAXT_000918 [Thalassiosira profunda]
MLSVRRPQARTLGSQGFQISTTKDTLDSPVSDDTYGSNPFLTGTPGSEGSAFEPVPPSPPQIRRKPRTEGNPFVLEALETPKRPTTRGAEKLGSPCDTTQATSLHSPGSRLADERPKKSSSKGAFKHQIKQIKSHLPKAPKVRIGPTTKSSVDLADLAVATICIVPRHGAGIAVGRRPFERMRTSLMLHMVQENHNVGWKKKGVDDEEFGRMKKGKAQVAKLDVALRNCVADEKMCFVEKSQEAVKLAKDALEGLNYDPKSELGRRNITCLKFLSGNYRKVVNGEKKVPSHDGLSLMVVGSAYYALGKFENALSVYQKAGVELMKNIDSSPECALRCAKLFNNLGVAYFEMDEYEKAMRTFQRALGLFQRDGGDDYGAWSAAILDQACIMNNMAYTLIKFKEYEDASELVDASFELQQILPGRNNIMTVSTLSTMAFVYYRMKKYKQSLDTYSACIQLQDKSSMYSESDQVEILQKMIHIAQKVKDHEKRVYLLRTKLVYQQCYLLEDDEEIFETHAELAEALQAFADSGGSSI